MRFSPYAMEDYGLQHRHGYVCPVNVKQYDEAMWNLIWASTPELDKYLDIAYEDFDAFKALNLGFPFERKGQAVRALESLTGLQAVFATGTPLEAFLSMDGYAGQLRSLMGVGADAWMANTAARLGIAQTLVDVTQAAALCQSIIAVDFRARRRL